MTAIESINEIIDFLEKFEPNIDDTYYDTINSIYTRDYQSILKSYNELFTTKVKEVFSIVDLKLQNGIINKINERIENLKELPFDKMKYKYTEMPIEKDKYNMDILPPFKYFPDENYQISLCYKTRIETITDLKESFTWLLNIGGYKVENGMLLGPLSSNTISLKRIKTKFNIQEFSYFLKLMIDARIIDCDQTSDVAEMVSKNFINSNGEHFDKKSISNKITTTAIHKTHKENVLNELKSIIKKNT
jgi:hypothetical protein